MNDVGLPPPSRVTRSSAKNIRIVNGNAKQNRRCHGERAVRAWKTNKNVVIVRTIYSNKKNICI